MPYRLVHRRLDVFLTATAVAIFHQGERVASHPRSAAKAHHTTTSEHMPPAHQAMAKRTPDKLRTEAAALGLAIGTYVNRLLDARELCGASQWFGKLTIYALASRLSASCMAAITAEQVPIRSRYRL